MFSLNEEFTEFNLQELETRLETDPLAVSGLFNIHSNVGTDPDVPMPLCTDYSCGVDIF